MCTLTKTRVRGVQFSRWVTFRGGGHATDRGVRRTPEIAAIARYR